MNKLKITVIRTGRQCMTRALSAALALAALTGPAMATPIHHQPPAPVPVGLPATGWLMLVGLGALLIKGKSYTT